MSINFFNQHRHRKVNLKILNSLTPNLLREMGIYEYELTFFFVGARKMAQINEDYLGHHGSTDVITFQYIAPALKEKVFGDVFICIDQADIFAAEYNTSTQSEVLRYLIHSVLHLQGYDDIDDEDRKIMKYHENKWVKWSEGKLNSELTNLVQARKNEKSA